MKLFVTDYDGTLFTGEKEIKKTIKKLKKLIKNDFLIVIATGRSYPSIHNQTDIYNIPYDYLCCADGSVIYDNKGNMIEHFIMDQSITKAYQNFYQKLNYDEIQFVYPEGYSNILKEDGNLLGINVCIPTINYTDDIINDFIKMSKHYPKYNFLTYKHPNFSYLCIKPKGITKSSSISYLANLNNILKEDIYVIGDSGNDYEMIRDFNGVAISESNPDILKIASKKYKSIDNYIDDIL